MLLKPLPESDGEIASEGAGALLERGGGGNFGVVTEFVFRLHKVGPLVTAGMLVFPFERAAEILRCARDVLADAPDELTTALALVTVPPHEPFPQELWGQKAVGIVPVYAGDLEAGASAVEPLRQLAEPALDLVGPMPYVALQSMLDDTAPHGLHDYNAAETLADLDDGAIEAVLAAFAAVPSARSHVILTQMGGASGRVEPTATAYAQRDAGWLAWVIGVWDPAEDDESNVAWVRVVRRALEPFAAGGTYVNALEPEAGTTGRVAASYGANWQRLVELKRQWDPENVFRLNQNISPA